MEKLINKAMQNPTPENKARVLAHNRKHPFASIFLPDNLQTILNQYAGEAA